MRRIFLEKYISITWIIVLLIASTIFYLSSISAQGGKGTSILAILYHFLIFFWFAFFLAIAFTQGTRIKLLIPSILFASLFAISDEFHQLFVPFRACSFEDFLVDLAGILLASFLYLVTLLIRTKKESKQKKKLQLQYLSDNYTGYQSSN